MATVKPVWRVTWKRDDSDCRMTALFRAESAEEAVSAALSGEYDADIWTGSVKVEPRDGSGRSESFAFHCGRPE